MNKIVKTLNTLLFRKSIGTLLILFIVLGTLAFMKTGKTRHEKPRPTFHEFFEGTRSYTMELAEAMPADKYTFRPTDSVRSFGEQMAHIAMSSKMLLDVFIKGGSMPTEEGFKEADKIEQEMGKNKEACIKALEEAFEDIRTTYDSMTPEQLEETFVVPFDPNGASFNKHKGFEFVKDHLLHHRGQALVSLRMQGIPAPPYRLY